MGDLPPFTNSTNKSQHVNLGWDVPLPFQPLLVSDLVLSCIEIALLSLAAYQIPGWMNNYRSYLLLQLSFVRLLKRMIYCIQYANFYVDELSVKLMIFGFRAYIDLVLTILVLCFIKHMYQSLIIVIVKVTAADMYKGLVYTWLTPVPFAVFWIDMVSLDFTSEWMANLLICFIFKVPLIVFGTVANLVIVRKVFCDKRMKFARVLTVTTFLICFIVNLNMVSKDVVWLFFKSGYLVISYVSELVSNVIVMTLYILLLVLNYYSIKNIKNVTEEETELNVA